MLANVVIIVKLSNTPTKKKAKKTEISFASLAFLHLENGNW